MVTCEYLSHRMFSSIDYWYSYQYIKILVVCACVRDGCGRGNSLNYCYSGHSELNATRGMPSWALAIALATDKNTRSFAVLNQKEIRFFTYVSQRAGGEAATAISLGSFTGAGDFVLQLIRLESLGSELQES